MTYAADGAHLAAIPTEPLLGHCEGCGDPLGDEPWWVTTLPNGIHTRCRRWEEEPYPFSRHLEVTRRLIRRLPAAAAADARAAHGWLLTQRRHWPKGGARSVERGFALMRRLRCRLGAAGVEPRLLQEL